MSILFKSLLLLLLAKAGATTDECSNATLITLIQGSDPFVEDGSTSQASQVPQGDSAMSCNVISSSTRGVWYMLEGDDRCYTALTLGSAFDTVLAVYKTSIGCEALSCLAENDDSANTEDLTSEVSFAATTGEDYYILVAGYSNSTGQYVITVKVRCFDEWNVCLIIFYLTPLLHCIRERIARRLRLTTSAVIRHSSTLFHLWTIVRFRRTMNQSKRAAQ